MRKQALEWWFRLTEEEQKEAVIQGRGITCPVDYFWGLHILTVNDVLKMWKKLILTNQQKVET